KDKPPQPAATSNRKTRTGLRARHESRDEAIIKTVHAGARAWESTEKSPQPAAPSNRKTDTGWRARHESRDEAIIKRLRDGARPGEDPECSWKTFCHSIRKDANGWISGSKLPKPGFSDKAIQRVTRALQLQRGK